jgi:hypothetical protein
MLLLQPGLLESNEVGNDDLYGDGEEDDEEPGPLTVSPKWRATRWRNGILLLLMRSVLDRDLGGDEDGVGEEGSRAVVLVTSESKVGSQLSGEEEDEGGVNRGLARDEAGLLRGVLMLVLRRLLRELSMSTVIMSGDGSLPLVRNEAASPCPRLRLARLVDSVLSRSRKR